MSAEFEICGNFIIYTYRNWQAWLLMKEDGFWLAGLFCQTTIQPINVQRLGANLMEAKNAVKDEIIPFLKHQQKSR